MKTLPQLFRTASGQFASNILIWEKIDTVYKGITYREIDESVNYLAAGLLKLGIGKGDKIALLSEGSIEWFITELAILYTGAVVVPVSVKLSEPSELIFRLNHSDSSFVFVSENHHQKIRKINSSLPGLKSVIIIGNKVKLTKDELFYDTLLEEGKKHFGQYAEELEKRLASLTGDDLASISYTSGTTSDPKGIMLTHRNYTANVEQANSLFNVPEWYVTLLILPWDHAFAHTVGLYTMISNGASIAVAETGKTSVESIRNIPKNIKEIKPVFLLSVPALARSFKKNIEIGIVAKGARVERLFKRALKLAYQYNGDTYSNAKYGNPWLKIRMWLVDKLVFSQIRQQFGGRMKFFIGGGALLDLELQQFFYAIGIPMFQGYGLSEAAPVISSNTPEKHKLGSSGFIVDKLELKIIDELGKQVPDGKQGEIAVKGENVMKGYWKNEKATNEVLQDGWLHTGDLGYKDSDGFLFVLGRYKSLMIGNDGEKFSPEGIEESLVDNSPFVDQCMLYNNQSPYTVALIVPNKKAIKDALSSSSIYRFGEEAVKETLFLIQGEIDQFYQGGKHELMFPARWLPSAIAILDEPFTEENKMINSTLKLVRSKVVEKNRATIDYLYTPEGKRIDNASNQEAVRRLLAVGSEIIQDNDKEDQATE